ncbi:hypothetical protein PENTCL1PPCAC_26717, partial [Pristionchus entomophagus]
LPPHPSNKTGCFVLGPIIYQDNSDEGDTTRDSSRIPNNCFSSFSPTPDIGSITFRSSDSSSKSTKKKSSMKRKKERETSKKSKKERKCKFSNEKEEKDDDTRREKSAYQKRKRAKIIELAKRAEQEHDKLMEQRTRAQQTTKEIETSMRMEQDSRNRWMAMMKNQVEGMDWRSSRYLKDVRREIKEWKGKTVMSSELAKRVDIVEQRVNVLEK